jgi:NAD(P)-dependent dehydrogenase (short-subunit alcohol dehydrogenase family)
MTELKGKKVAVIGGNRNVGRAIVEAMHEAGAQVLAVARNAVGEEAPHTVFSVFEPDVLVMVAGVRPTILRSLDCMTRNWESSVG